MVCLMRKLRLKLARRLLTLTQKQLLLLREVLVWIRRLAITIARISFDHDTADAALLSLVVHTHGSHLLSWCDVLQRAEQNRIEGGIIILQLLLLEVVLLQRYEVFTELVLHHLAQERLTLLY